MTTCTLYVNDTFNIFCEDTCNSSDYESIKTTNCF